MNKSAEVVVFQSTGSWIGWNDGRGMIFRGLPGSAPGSPSGIAQEKVKKHENMTGAKPKRIMPDVRGN